jgi:acetyl esterase/lipase
MPMERIKVSDAGFLDAYLNDGPKDLKRPAILICPGGGYYCVSGTESAPVAEAYRARGFNAFVLNYSVMEGARFPEDGFRAFRPFLELKVAMNLLREGPERFRAEPDRTVLCGFSAGGHLAAGYCFSGIEDAALPAALILSYPLIALDKGAGRRTGPDTESSGAASPAARAAMNTFLFGSPIPTEKQLSGFSVANMSKAAAEKVVRAGMPVFIWHTKDDKVIPYESSVAFSKVLEGFGVDHTLKIYEHGVHGDPFSETHWRPDTLAWLAGQGIS